MSKQKAQYEEGDCFAVPVDGGGYGAVVIARKVDHGVPLGYFFGPLREKHASNEITEGLHASDALCVWQFSDEGIAEGRWPQLGKVPNWNREAWPVPEFYNDWRSKVVVYNDDLDPISEHRIARQDGRSYERDCSRGHLAVEYALALRLRGLKGISAFDEDVAFHWVYELIKKSDIEFLRATLSEVLRSSERLDKETALRGLAAVETVAAFFERPKSPLPDDFHDWMDENWDWDVSDLVQPAIASVDSVLSGHSELAQAWASSDTLFADWESHLLSLKERLERAESKNSDAAG